MTQRNDNQMPIGERATRPSFAILMLGIVLACIVVGCSTEARYRIKTVIFTGVPPLHEEDKQDEQADPARNAKAEQLARQEQFREALKSRYWQHGPFASGECGRCHNLSQSKSFVGNRSVTSQEPTSVSSVSAPSRLNMPPQQLCVACHEQHAEAFALRRGLQQHSPVAAGACTGCHNPHQSLRQYMLLGTDNRELCGGCHDSMALSPSHSEDPAQDCVNCHNAHVGVTRKLLRSDAGEIGLLYDGRDDE